jgi:hypothetical protein
MQYIKKQDNSQDELDLQIKNPGISILNVSQAGIMEDTTARESKRQESKRQETKLQETKLQETKPQEPRAKDAPTLTIPSSNLYNETLRAELMELQLDTDLLFKQLQALSNRRLSQSGSIA